MSEKKTEQAMRLFEAMEGVDPELLARSEKENKVLPFQRYARAMKTMAACLALIVVGGTCFVILQNGGGQKAKNESAMAPMSDSAQLSGNRSDSAKNAMDTQSAWSNMEANDDGSKLEAEAACEADFSWDEAPAEGTQANAIATDQMESSKAQSSQNSATSGTEKEITIGDLKKGLLSVLQIRSKGTYAVQSPNQLNGAEISIDGGEPVRFGTAKAAELMMLVSDLELEPVGEQTLTEYVECGLCDDDGVVSSWFRIGGKYLQVVDTDEFYEILNDDFNYDTWRADIEAALQEE